MEEEQAMKSVNQQIRESGYELWLAFLRPKFEQNESIWNQTGNVIWPTTGDNLKTIILSQLREDTRKTSGIR